MSGEYCCYIEYCHEGQHGTLNVLKCRIWFVDMGCDMFRFLSGHVSKEMSTQGTSMMAVAMLPCQMARYSLARFPRVAQLHLHCQVLRWRPDDYKAMAGCKPMEVWMYDHAGPCLT